MNALFPEYDHSAETLLHIRCRLCSNWWSMSEGRPERCYYCPYCGQKLSPAQYSDVPPKNTAPGELPL